MNKTKNAPANHEDQLDEAIRRRNLWMKRRDKLVVQIDEIADTLQIKHPSLNTAVFVEQIKSEIASLQKELAITRKEVEQLQQFAQEAYVSKRALGLACKAIDIKSECPYWNETPIAACPSNVADFPCDRSSEDCWIEYFMEEAKQ